MAVLKQSNCSAAIAFSPIEELLSTGTYFDTDFNDSSKLEVRSTDLSQHGNELHVLGGPVSSSSQFQRLAWSKPLPTLEGKRGIIATSLSDGKVVLWDAAKVIQSRTSVTPISTLPSGGSGGAVKGLSFNTLTSPHLLATGGPQGQLTIWDLKSPRQPKPTDLSSHEGANGRSSEPEVTSVVWNPKVDHILASSAGGYVYIWDTLKKKLRQSFFDKSRNPNSISSMCWNPLIATEIVVAYEDNKNPVIQLWNLKSTDAPMREFVGHEQGILAVSWCPQDPSMLLSTSKDCRTILWEKSGHKLGEFTSPSYNSDVVWSPTNPGVFAISSRAGVDGQEDGSVTLHDFSSLKADPIPLEDGSYTEAPLSKCPAWLKRPCGVSFGFGGKLVSFNNEKPKPGTPQKATISLRQVHTDSQNLEMSPEFQAAMSDLTWENMQSFCQAQAEKAEGDDLETWKFINLYYSEGDRNRNILEHLGFGQLIPEPSKAQEASLEEAEQSLDLLTLNGTENGHTEQHQEPEGDGMDFFDEDHTSIPSPQIPQESVSVKQPPTPKPETPRTPKVVAGPREEDLQRALYVGNYAKAIDICLEANRMADALIIGNLGGGLHYSRAQNEYMKREPHPYMQVIRAVSDSNLLGLIKASPLENWRETLAAIFAHAGSDEITDLCDALARHLFSHGQYHAAILSWICAGNVDQTVRAWTQTLKQKAPEGDNLQALVERSVIFYWSAQSQEQSSALSELLSQYAGLLASQGNMVDAITYLSLVETGDSGPAAILKYRIYHSGVGEIPPLDPEPSYPFEETPQLPETTQSQEKYQPQAQENIQPPTPQYQNQAQQYQPPTQQFQSSAPKMTQQSQSQPRTSYFEQNAYTVSGRYNQSQQGPPPQNIAPPSTHTSHGTFQGGAQQTPSLPNQFHTNINHPSPGVSRQTSLAPLSPKPSNDYATNSSYRHPTQSSGFQAPQQQPPFQAPQQSSQYQQTNPSNAWNSQPHAQTPYSEPQSTAYNPGLESRPGFAPPKPTSVVQPGQFVPTRTSVPAPAPKQIVPPTTAYNPQGTFASQNSTSKVPYQSQNPGPFQQQNPTPYQAQGSVSQPAPSEPPAPPPKVGPPANLNIKNADVSKIGGQSQKIVSVLRNVYEHCSQAAQSSPSRKREMEDTGKRLGQLLWKLNNQELSSHVVDALIQLCQALEARAFDAANQKQAQLTTSDWDECSAFLTGLKRLIKTASQLQ